MRDKHSSLLYIKQKGDAYQGQTLQLTFYEAKKEMFMRDKHSSLRYMKQKRRFL